MERKVLGNHEPHRLREQIKVEDILLTIKTKKWTRVMSFDAQI